MAVTRSSILGVTALEKTLRGLAAVAALVPGAAILLKVVPLPPNISDLLGGLSIAFGVATVIAVICCREYIARASRFGTALLVIAGASVGTALGVEYFAFGHQHVVNYTQVSSGGAMTSVSHVAPMHPSSELKAILDQFDGDYGESLRSPVYGQKVAALMDQQSLSATALLTTFLLGAQAFLIGAVVAGAWKVTDFFAATAEPKDP